MASILRQSILDHDFNRAAADHDRSNWKHTIYLQENGEVDVFTDHGGGQPMTAYNQRDLYLCSVPDGTADVTQLVDQLQEYLGALEQVEDGHTVEFDGSNMSGQLTEEASNILDEIRTELERWIQDAASYGGLPSYWRAGDWLFSNGVNREDIARAHREDRSQVLDELIAIGLDGEAYVDRDDLNQELDWVKENYCSLCFEKDCDCKGVSDEQIRVLSQEAVSAGDETTVMDCALALDGDADARERCAEAVKAAKAMEN